MGGFMSGLFKKGVSAKSGGALGGNSGSVEAPSDINSRPAIDTSNVGTSSMQAPSNFKQSGGALDKFKSGAKGLGDFAQKVASHGGQQVGQASTNYQPMGQSAPLETSASPQYQELMDYLSKVGR